MARGKRKDNGRTDWSGADAASAAPASAAPAPELSRADAPVKAEEQPRAARRSDHGQKSGIMAQVTYEAPSRADMEREAADELQAALAESYGRLKAEVPGAASAEDAQRKIEGELGRVVPDNDAGIPSHPIYQGDALVYYQLRRHYGSPNAGGSFRRSWYPLQPG